MKIKVYTETVIDYAHYLTGYEGNCKNLHGHTGWIRVWCRGEESQLNDVGMLFDFNNIKRIKDEFDHKNLNDHSYFTKRNPTAENLCIFIYNFLKKSMSDLEFKVRFYETAIGKSTYAEIGDFE